MRPFRLRRLARFFFTFASLMAAPMLAPLTALAGSYTITYSGGTTVRAPGGTYGYNGNQVPNGLGGNSNGSCYPQPGPPATATTLSVVNSGTITAQFN